MKKYFITGLIILLPLVLTIMVIFFLVNFFTAPFVHLVETHLFAKGTLPSSVTLFISRILALILLSIFIFILGFIARWFLIKNIISATSSILSRIPLIKSVYKISKEVFSALFSLDGKRAFKYPVLIPFPRKPTYCMGFQAGEVAEEIKQTIKAPLVSVFAPTAPHPITGFLFLVPEHEVHKLDMTNEEAVKYLISCGLIHTVPKEEKDE